MYSLKTISELGILLIIVWIGIRNAVFAKSKDEREILAAYNATRTSMLLYVFILGFIIILNLLNKNVTIPIVYIFVVTIISLIFIAIVYKINLNTEVCFLGKIDKEKREKILWGTFSISVFLEICLLITIFISYKYFNLRGLKIFVVLAYVLGFISHYLLCKIDLKRVK